MVIVGLPRKLPNIIFEVSANYRLSNFENNEKSKKPNYQKVDDKKQYPTVELNPKSESDLIEFSQHKSQKSQRVPRINVGKTTAPQWPKRA